MSPKTANHGASTAQFVKARILDTGLPMDPLAERWFAGVRAWPQVQVPSILEERKARRISPAVLATVARQASARLSGMWTAKRVT